jgi:hypothetical protein
VSFEEKKKGASEKNITLWKRGILGIYFSS